MLEIALTPPDAKSHELASSNESHKKLPALIRTTKKQSKKERK